MDVDNKWVGSGQLAANRDRQRELYGAPLGERVRRVTGVLGITQSRLARTLGLSPAMLSQLVSGRRVKIGDPAVLARLMLIDKRCPAADPGPGPEAVEQLLTEIRDARLHWTGGPQPSVAPTGPAPSHSSADPARAAERRPRCQPPEPRRTAADALRAVAGPSRLVAAAARLDPMFPELAAVFRQAAAGRP
ncbi:hypothetical protein ACFQE5_02950 [Pseudonocardia hispaniensis]|uniref:Helix-turn-helix protein n=1 Tax=Pseudonocardia hispaniensis TaxID=904933 RepID=A0ABW1IXH4_9PSEU